MVVHVLGLVPMVLDGSKAMVEIRDPLCTTDILGEHMQV